MDNIHVGGRSVWVVWLMIFVNMGDGGDSDDDCQVLKKIQFHMVLIAIVCKKNNISSFTFSCIFDD